MLNVTRLSKHNSRVIDKKGTYLFGPQANFIKASEGIYYTEPRERGELYKFINSEGEIMFERYFDYVGSFREGFAKVEIDGKWGYLDKVGKVPIVPQFEDAGDFAEGLAEVKIKGKWGFINKMGKVVVPAMYDYVYKPFNCGLAYVVFENRRGYINKKGKWVWLEKRPSVK